MHHRLIALLAAAVFFYSGCVNQIGAPTGGSAPEQTIDFATAEGTMLALDVSADGRIVMDLLGQLWLVPAGGGEARVLTSAVADTAEDQDPAFSPDGRHIAFKAERGGRRGIWLLELGAPPPRLLVEITDKDAFAGEPAWSPDGTRIALARTPPIDSAGARRFSRIAIVDVATRSLRDLHVENHPAANLRMPAWMPDGTRLAFVEMVDETWLTGPGGRVWTVDAGGGTAAPLTGDGLRAIAPAIAPDRGHFAFLAPDSSGRLQVWTAEVDGGAARRLTDHSDVASTRVRWSADGQSLFYSADGRLWRIAASGGASQEISFSARLVFSRPSPMLPPARFPEPGEEQPARGFAGLALSPDAAQYAMLALGKLWVADVGGAARMVAKLPHTARYLTWSSDGTEVAWSAGDALERDIFATDIVTGLTRQVTALPGRELNPSFSPDGRWLAFVHSDSTTTLRLIPHPTEVIADTSATRHLGSAEANWTGSDTFEAPEWSPDSDRLLRRVGWNADGTTAAELISVSGMRTPAAPLPDWGNHVRWTRAGLVWTRHDRLWTAAYDGSSLPRTPQPIGDAPAAYASASADGSVLFMSEGGLRFRSSSGIEHRLGWPVRYTAPVPTSLLIRNVRIIDGKGAGATAPMDVVIERGRITRLADAGSQETDARIIDAEGRFAMPGLMDLHAHTYWPELLPGFLYFGVTLVRDQGAGSVAHLASYADAIASGAIAGPRVSFGGFQYHSDVSFDTDVDRGIEPEADEDHLRRTVAVAEAFGAHHLKTRGFRRWDINARLIREAHRRGIRVTGHCAIPLPLIAAGIDSKEHVGVCRSRGFVGMYSDMTQYDDVNRLLREAAVGVVPTIIYFAFAAYINRDPRLLESDADLRPFLHEASIFEWMLNLSAAERDRHVRAAQDARETAAKLHRMGVTIGAGSDIWQIGTGTHMEMQEMVTAGLSAAEVIQGATLSAARIVGVDADLGSIEVGKLADIVLLEADPLADIRNTRRIWMVLKGGEVVDRAQILAEHRVKKHRR